MQITLLYVIRAAHSGVSEYSSLLGRDTGTRRFEISSRLNPEGEWDLHGPITLKDTYRKRCIWNMSYVISKNFTSTQ